MSAGTSKTGDTYLSLDGTGYAEIPSLSAYSVDRTGELTVAAWMRPDVEEFEHQDCDTYRGPATQGCSIQTHDGQQVVINPLGGSAPLRIGTQDKISFFQGGITRVRIWGRALTPDEINAVYQSGYRPA